MRKIAAISSLTLISPALAQEPGAQAVEAQDPAGAGPVEWVGGAPLWEWTRATGNWGGARDWLEERGVEVGGGLTVDWAAPWSGGLRHRDTVCSLLDVNVAFDLEQLVGLPRTLAYVDAYSIQGRDPSGDVGDIQASRTSRVRTPIRWPKCGWRPGSASTCGSRSARST